MQYTRATTHEADWLSARNDRTEPNRTEAKRNEIRRRLNRIRRDTRVILIHIRLSIRWRRSIFRHGFFRMMFRTVDSPLFFVIFSKRILEPMEYFFFTIDRIFFTRFIKIFCEIFIFENNTLLINFSTKNNL